MVAGCPATVTPLIVVLPEPVPAVPSELAVVVLTIEPICRTPATETSVTVLDAFETALRPSTVVDVDDRMLPADTTSGESKRWMLACAVAPLAFAVARMSTPGTAR
jgi:hypothetical protein